MASGRDRVSQRVKGLPASGIRRFFDLIASMEGVISLGVGEPDFVTPWGIREAAIHSLEQGQTMYTSNYGLLELRQELANYLYRLYRLEYNPRKEILITVGVSEGVDIALRAILDPGDEVLAPEPAFVSYMPCTVLAGGIFVPVPTSMEGEFRVKAGDIEARMNRKSKALILNYPNNPTGTVMSQKELEEVAGVARRHDLLVVSDEVYSRLTYGVEHTCVATLPRMRERTILLGGFSKNYAMTGWRIGFAAAPAEVLEAMMKVHQYAIMCAPTMSQYAALEALRSGEGAIAEMVKDYDRRRRLMVKGFNDIGLPCVEPQGAFYAFPSIKGTGLSSEEFAEKLLLEEKVAVVPGFAFGEAGEGFVRCCYAASVPDLQEALKRIERFLRRHSP